MSLISANCLDKHRISRIDWIIRMASKQLYCLLMLGYSLTLDLAAEPTFRRDIVQLFSRMELFGKTFLLQFISLCFVQIFLMNCIVCVFCWVYVLYWKYHVCFYVFCLCVCFFGVKTIFCMLGTFAMGKKHLNRVTITLRYIYTNLCVNKLIYS